MYFFELNLIIYSIRLCNPDQTTTPMSRYSAKNVVFSLTRKFQITNKQTKKMMN